MTVRVAVDASLRGRVPAFVVRTLERVARRGAARLGLGQGLVGVRLVGDAVMIELHRRHLGSAVPTDVLSFPPLSLPFADGDVDVRPDAGDIAIDWDQVIRQAPSRGIAAWTEEAAQLVVHGLAHLAGHDHDAPQRARKMERAEIRAARTACIGVPRRPYARRGAP